MFSILRRGRSVFAYVIPGVAFLAGTIGCTVPTPDREQRAELEALRSRDVHQLGLIADAQTKLRQLAGETQVLAAERARLIGRLNSLTDNDETRSHRVRALGTKIAGMEARLNIILEETAFLRASQERAKSRQEMALVPMDVLLAATRRQEYPSESAATSAPRTPFAPPRTPVTQQLPPNDRITLPPATSPAPADPVTTAPITPTTDTASMPAAPVATAAVTNEAESQAESDSKNADSKAFFLCLFMGGLIVFSVILTKVILIVIEYFQRRAETAGVVDAYLEETSSVASDEHAVEDEDPTAEEFAADGSLEGEDSMANTKYEEYDEYESLEYEEEVDSFDGAGNAGDPADAAEEPFDEVAEGSEAPSVEEDETPASENLHTETAVASEQNDLDLGDFLRPLDELESEIKSKNREKPAKANSNAAKVTAHGMDLDELTRPLDEIKAESKARAKKTKKSRRTKAKSKGANHNSDDKMRQAADTLTPELTAPQSGDRPRPRNTQLIPGVVQDEMGRTQVMPSMSPEVELEGEKTKVIDRSDTVNDTPTQVISGIASADFGDTKVMASFPQDEGSSTQIIPKDKFKKTPHKRAAQAKPSQATEKTLLDELEQLMGGK